MITETPLAVMELPEGYYFNLKPAPKHSIFRSVVQVQQRGFPFSRIVAEAGYMKAEDWTYVANELANELWAWYDRKENR